MAEKQKKKKLSKEELHAENEKMRAELKSRDYTSKEDQERLVKSLSKKNMLSYALVIFLPPIGIWYIWTHKEELNMRTTSLYLWTFVGIMVVYAWIRQIVTGGLS